MIIGIPVMLLAIVQSIILSVCAIIAWFAILFTGKLPEGLFNPMRSAMAYLVRTTGYFLLITEDCPPFSYEENGRRLQRGRSRARRKAALPRPKSGTQ